MRQVHTPPRVRTWISSSRSPKCDPRIAETAVVWLVLALFGAIVTLLSLLEVAVSFSLRWAIVLACPHVARYVFVLNVHVVGKCLREPLGRWVAIIFQLTYH